MKINAIYCKACKEILYSTHVHDFRMCSCKDGTYVDGGFEYFKYGITEDIEVITLDGDVLLKLILTNDYRYGNRNISDEWKDRYHGKFKITDKSNMEFFNKLVIEWRGQDGL